MVDFTTCSRISKDLNVIYILKLEFNLHHIMLKVNIEKQKCPGNVLKESA